MQRAKAKWVRSLEPGDERKEAENRPDSVFFGNMTTWGQQARSYLVDEDGLESEGKWSMVGLAEHHLGDKQVYKLRGAMRVAGYRSCVVPAASTGKSAEGTHGGVSVSAKARLAATVTDPQARHQGDHVLSGDGWATAILHKWPPPRRQAILTWIGRRKATERDKL